MSAAPGLILAVDLLRPPLTGVGRYTFELVRGLQAHPEAPATRFLRNGRWICDPLAGAEAAAPTGPGARLRARWAAHPLAARLHRQIQHRRARRALQGMEDHLYHAPSLYLPPFGGASVVTLHDLSVLHHPHCHPAGRVQVVARELPRTLDRAHHLITVTEAVRRELIMDHGVPPGRITAIHNGVDPGFHPRPAQALAPVMAAHGLRPGGYILCVATLEPRKNIPRLIQAHGRLPEPLRRHHPLVLAGAHGWNSEGIATAIRDAARQGRVHHLRYVPQDHLPALYAGAALMAYPSLYEGFGLPVLEAMACGTPVVTSTDPALVEVAGGAALHVSPHDTTALGAALERALEDRTWRQAARQRGLARARQLTWSRCVERTVALYHTLMPR
ncbi:glycosyltransferase family 4 protein [Ectothiorhodospira mobilis]|uniref:glycosyltransferase family 4 protein n=1 Tax=Ectothiorhodospira mobilis TaxID=195064 RepID=UPI001EE8A49D|nr:glycosyltransferase family 1 protein [Ectothiorhodospira mobilis]MCG5534673.1 glycosyltransferase family 4 protein [Ectothiorhodospira mobilis]